SIVAAAASLLATVAAAGQVKFKDGTSVDCAIVQQSADQVTVLFHASLLRIPKSEIAEIDGDGAPSIKASPREWTDISGKFRVNATFMRSESGNVVLRSTNEKDITVALERLSEADQRYVRDLTAQLKADPAKLRPRVPALKEIVVTLGSNDWAAELRQIP